jgi:hypothetical protein
MAPIRRQLRPKVLVSGFRFVFIVMGPPEGGHCVRYFAANANSWLRLLRKITPFAGTIVP